MSKTTILAIDPGHTGAVAWRQALFDPDGSIAGEEVSVQDTPTFWIPSRKARRRYYDIPAMVRLIRRIQEQDAYCRAVIEKQQPYPGQGVVSQFTTGYGLGIWEGIMVSLDIGYELVAPSRWQNTILGATKGKSASLAEARRRYPKLADQLRKPSDHGRADALLLLAYAS